VACAWFATRALPPPVPAPAPSAQSFELSAMHGLPPSSREQRLELAAEESSVRFLVEGTRGELLVACTAVHGSLVLGANNTGGELELHLDLGSLQPLGEPVAGLDVAHVLGVHRGSEIVYRATLAATTTSDLPGVCQRTWLGTLRLGGRALQQPMQLWQCSLPGQLLRLQGHGSVAAADYGLPLRRVFGLLAEQHVVTLGLDLAWRRPRAR
jgi:hypothetical protein